MSNAFYTLRSHYVLAAMQIRIEELEAALEKIAAPCRADGTWNLSRAACEQIAREALGRTDDRV